MCYNTHPFACQSTLSNRAITMNILTSSNQIRATGILKKRDDLSKSKLAAWVYLKEVRKINILISIIFLVARDFHTIIKDICESK